MRYLKPEIIEITNLPKSNCMNGSSASESSNACTTGSVLGAAGCGNGPSTMGNCENGGTAGWYSMATKRGCKAGTSAIHTCTTSGGSVKSDYCLVGNNPFSI